MVSTLSCPHTTYVFLFKSILSTVVTTVVKLSVPLGYLRYLLTSTAVIYRSSQYHRYVTTTAWSMIFSFLPSHSFLLFAMSLPLLHFPPTPSLCRCIPLLRVASSVQQPYVFLEYVCSPSSSLSDLLASLVLGFISDCIFYCLVLIFWSRLFCCVLVPGTQAFHLLGP